jgi:hypothetical protein
MSIALPFVAILPLVQPLNVAPVALGRRKIVERDMAHESGVIRVRSTTAGG